MAQRFLKRVDSGAIYAFTEALAAAPGIVEVDSNGRLVDSGVQAEANLQGTSSAQKTIEILEVKRDELQEEVDQLRQENKSLREKLAEGPGEAPEPTMGVSAPEGGTLGDPQPLDALIEPIKADKEALEALGRERFNIELDRRYSAAKMIERLKDAEASRAGME